MIKLKNHQQKVVDYLINRCYNQRSILLFHFMGTGKTITSLKFLSHFIKKKKFLIVCPNNIIQTWLMEIKVLNLNPKFFHIIDYNEFITTMKTLKTKDTFIVLDECHQLCQYLRIDKKDNQIQDIYDKIHQYEKKLLLSGTPIYEYPSDLCHIINLVSESKSFPTDEQSFLEKYGRPKYPKSIFLWMFRLYINKLIQYVIILITVYYGYIYFLSLMFFDNIYLHYYDNVKNKDTTIQIIDDDNNKYFAKYIKRSIFSQSTKDFMIIIVKLLDDEMKKSPSKIFFNRLHKFFTIKAYFLVYSKLKDYLDKNPSLKLAKYGEIKDPVFKSLSFKKNIFTYTMVFSTTIIPLLLFLFPFIKNKIEFNKNTRRDFYSIDYSKIGKKIGRFISYSPIPKDIEHLFPGISYQTIYHSYSNRQLKTFVNFSDSTLSDQEILLLNVSDNVEYNNLLKINIQDNVNALKKIGLKIGNITSDIISNDTITRINKYNGFTSKKYIGSNNKFDFILNKILNSDTDEKIAIYSNFEVMGTEIFSAFLNYNKIDHFYLDIHNSIEERKYILENFNVKSNSKKRVIILNPAFIEGISLIGIRQFHILEPVDILSKYEQIIARSRRMNSHMHLPENKRDVVVYNHVCNLSFKNKFFDYIFIFTTKWFSSNSWKVFINEQNLLAYHKQDISPDLVLFNKLYASKNETEKFIGAISHITIENISDSDLKEVCKSRNH